MSLSQKSKYVPPHLRAKSDPNKEVIVVNPDDEMPPQTPPGLRGKSMQNHHMHQRRKSPQQYAQQQQQPIMNTDWRSTEPTQQRELNLSQELNELSHQNSQRQPHQHQAYHSSNVLENSYAVKQRRRYHHQQQQQQRGQHTADPNKTLFAKVDEKLSMPQQNGKNYSISRYNRQCAPKQNENNYRSDLNMPPHHHQNEYGNNANYELSSNFQTISIKSNQNQPRRRRNNRNNNGNHPNENGNGQKRDSKNSQKRLSASNSPQNKSKKQRNLSEEKQNVNAFTISKASAAPINWAAQLKGKENGKSNDFDLSQGVSVDAIKVRHVLEVFNMTPADYQRVSSIFKHFQIDSFINSLICVKQRWFVVFDCYKSAIRALNIVKSDRFKLKRIDLNVRDVQMLKNNVPPPRKV